MPNNASNNKSKSTLFSLFVLAATSLATAIKDTKHKLTEKQAAIQAIFDKEKEPFGCYTTKVAEVFGILTGYKPVILANNGPTILQIRKVVAPTPYFAIVVGVSGYAYSEANANYVQLTTANSSLATKEESIAFLERLAANEKFANFTKNPVGWAYATLGADHGNALMKAIEEATADTATA